jgi:glutaredoxin 3
MTDEVKIVVYSKTDCIWCDKAKELLTKNNMPYTELMYGTDYSKEDLQKLLPPTTKLTTPQIFFNDVLIGGYQELETYLSVANAVDGITKFFR